ncbi:branched-chain amino acid ABC transporter permease [Pusillimonas sp. TS35]|uniref:AzlC family ABC transporter permease n=1 Tax=Paracandidimonas lactea TaxID=2895524 RepID=UPI001369692D|nr:branched-chain amino acid ABC transporter permease [Pusillimonas sp. TS35]
MRQIRYPNWWPDAALQQSFLAGFADVRAALIASGVWGFVTGIAMVKAGLSESAASVITLLVYAGSAQLTSLPLIASSSPLWLIFLAAMVVNLRFVIFGAALQPYFRHLSWRQRLALGYVSSDISFVVFMGRYGDTSGQATASQLWYYLGIVVPGWLCWNAFSLLGVFAGGFVPAAWSLDFAAILALLAIIIPLVRTRPMLMCLLVAASIAWVGQLLPLRLGLLAAVVGGVLAGVFTDQLQRRTGRQP